MDPTTREALKSCGAVAVFLRVELDVRGQDGGWYRRHDGVTGAGAGAPSLVTGSANIVTHCSI